MPDQPSEKTFFTPEKTFFAIAKNILGTLGAQWTILQVLIRTRGVSQVIAEADGSFKRGVVVWLLASSLSLGSLATFWKPLNAVFQKVWLWLKSIVILFLKPWEVRQQLSEIRAGVDAIARVNLFGEIFCPGRQEFDIIYSCNHPDHGSKTPMLKYDELACVSRLWSLAEEWHHTSVHQPRCCCQDPTLVDNWKFDPKLLKGDFAIVGSPQNNPACEWLMERLHELEAGPFRRVHRYYFHPVASSNGKAKKRLQLVSENAKDDPLCPSANEKVGQSDTDYAVIMRLPGFRENQPDRSRSIVLVAGCRMAGQIAATTWLDKTSNLRMLQKLSAQTPYFYVILKVVYLWGDGYPGKIEDPEVVCSSSIDELWQVTRRAT